jgi:hypothetical protein
MTLKFLLKFGAITLFAGAVAATPMQLLAQTTNKHAAKPTADNPTTKTPADAKTEKKAHPFRGKLAAVDKVAKTITVGKSVYQITSETKLKKSDKPATLEDGVVGEPVSGYVKPNADGKLVAATVTFGAKTEGKGEGKSPDKKKATQ